MLIYNYFMLALLASQHCLQDNNSYLDINKYTNDVRDSWVLLF